MATLAASSNAAFTRSQWLSWPSGSSVAWKAWPSRVPSMLVRPRLGSVSLASLGRTTKAHGASPSGLAGRRSLALKREVAGLVPVCLLDRGVPELVIGPVRGVRRLRRSRKDSHIFAREAGCDPIPLAE